MEPLTSGDQKVQGSLYKALEESHIIFKQVDILLEIFVHCHGSDAMKVRQVCRLWHEVLDSPLSEHVWRALSYRDFGVTLVPHGVAAHKHYATTYHLERYKVVSQVRLVDQRTHINQIDFTEDSKRVVIAYDDWSACIWDSNCGHLLHKLDHTSPVAKAFFVQSAERVITATWNGEVCIWDAVNGKRISTFSGHSKRVQAVDISEDSSLVLTASADKTARVWHVNSGICQCIFTSHTDAISFAAFGVDQKRAITVSHSHIFVWDIESGAVLRTLTGYYEAVSAVVHPKNWKITKVSKEQIACAWDIVDDKLMHEVANKEDASSKMILAFSSDGRYMISQDRDIENRKSVEVRNGENGNLAAVLEHELPCEHVFISPDQRHCLTVVGRNDLSIWDLETAKKVCNLANDHFENYYGNRVTRAIFSPDGKFVVTLTSEPIEAFLFDVVTGRWIRNLEDESSFFGEMAFTPDGSAIIGWSPIREARILHFNPRIENLHFSQ